MPPVSSAAATADEPRMFLSQEDVDRLLEDNSIDSRIEVVTKISGQYVGNVFSQNELLYAEQIFRLLMRDTEARVRQALARGLKEAENVPRDIIISLANDLEKIAIPIISSSDILSDADLIRIVENSHEVSKIEAVAMRGDVSERVSSALVGTHYPQVVKTLLENDNARISGKDYDAILNEHSEDAAITETMARRAQLPIPVVEKILNYVSESLGKELQAKYGVTLDKVRQQTQESMTLQLVPLNSSDADIEATIDQMISFDRLTPSIILSSLCQGHLRFFEIAMARLGKIPKANARKLIHDKGSLGFEALYERAQLPESMFDAVSLLLHAVIDLEKNPDLHPGSPLYTNAVVESMMARAGGQPVENLPYLIALVRQSIAH